MAFMSSGFPAEKTVSPGGGRQGEDLAKFSCRTGEPHPGREGVEDVAGAGDNDLGAQFGRQVQVGVGGELAGLRDAVLLDEADGLLQVQEGRVDPGRAYRVQRECLLLGMPGLAGTAEVGEGAARIEEEPPSGEGERVGDRGGMVEVFEDFAGRAQCASGSMGVAAACEGTGVSDGGEGAGFARSTFLVQQVPGIVG